MKNQSFVLSIDSTIPNDDSRNSRSLSRKWKRLTVSFLHSVCKYKYHLAMSKTDPHRFRDSDFYIDLCQSQSERVKAATPPAEKRS